MKERRGEVMVSRKELDYELNRANFSATAGLGLLGLSYVFLKDYHFWIALFFAIFGILFWTGMGIHYGAHFRLWKSPKWWFL
jgi:hypothetical protein